MSGASSKLFNVPWSWKQGLFVYFAAWIGLPIVLVFLLQSISGQFAPAKEIVEGLKNGEVEASFRFLLLDGFAALLLVKYFLNKHKVGWQALGLKPFNLFRSALYILVFFIAFIALVAGLFALLSWLVPGFNPNQAQVNEFTTNASNAPSITLLALVVFPAFLEELVFRGFIFPSLADRFGVILGVAGSSMLFAVAHLQANVSVYTFVLGALLAIMYLKLRSIWPGIFLHLLNNYLAFTALTHK